jgi:hypothetical protein
VLLVTFAVTRVVPGKKLGDSRLLLLLVWLLRRLLRRRLALIRKLPCADRLALTAPLLGGAA